MIISERIFELLKKRGMTQKDFSIQTGITQSTISDWKRKKTNPSSDKIMLICETLHITPYELLSGVEKDKYQPMDYVIVDKSSDDYLFLESYRNLDMDKKERLIGYMKALKE